MLDRLFRVEKENSAKIIFWALIGPSLLLFTLMLASFQKFSNLELFVAAVVGFFLCLKKEKKGLYWSLVLLIGTAVYQHLQLYQYHGFAFGLQTSVALSLFTCYAAFSYVKEQILAFEAKENEAGEKIVKAEEKLAREIDFHARQQKNFKFEMDRLTQIAEEKKQEVETLKSLTENLRRSLVGKEEKLALQENKKDQLNSLQKAVEEKHSQILENEKHIQELKHIEHLYYQLRVQFEEKKENLQQVRKELFLVKEEAENLKREIADNNFEDNPSIRELEQELGKLNYELKKFEKDSNDLEELVTVVLQEQKNSSGYSQIKMHEQDSGKLEPHQTANPHEIEPIEELPLEEIETKRISDMQKMLEQKKVQNTGARYENEQNPEESKNIEEEAPDEDENNEQDNAQLEQEQIEDNQALSEIPSDFSDFS